MTEKYIKPSREDIYRAWHGTDDPWGGCADSASIERVLDLLPGRSEAEVKAEALREASLKDVAGAAYDVLDQHGPTDMGYDETRALAERIGARFGERFVITERGDRG